MAYQVTEYCKCARCRNVHSYSDRGQKRDKDFPDIVCHISICPRCGAHEYYKVDKDGKHINN